MPAEDATKDLFRRYGIAYREMLHGEAACLQNFHDLARDYPNDPLVRLHVKRLSAGGPITARMELTEK